MYLTNAMRLESLEAALGVESVYASLAASYHGTMTHVKDIVFISLPNGELTVAEISLHMLTDPPLQGISNFCTLVALFRSERQNVWVRVGREVIVGIESIVAAAAWCRQSVDPDRRLVLTPSYVQHKASRF